jgi:HD superfamily phosphohydrolase
MKIKSFKDYSPTLQPLYKELDYSEYNKEFCKLVKFSEKEFKDLESKLSCDVKYKANNVHLYKDKNDKFTNQAFQIEVSGVDKTYIISKKYDEWYLIEEVSNWNLKYSNRKGKYYICDQYDELIMFFVDKNLMSNEED